MSSAKPTLGRGPARVLGEDDRRLLLRRGVLCDVDFLVRAVGPGLVSPTAVRWERGKSAPLPFSKLLNSLFRDCH